jgi:hypothetical protein
MPGEEIKVFPVLDDPSRSRQLGLHFSSRFLLGRFGHELNPRPRLLPPHLPKSRPAFARRYTIHPSSRALLTAA